MRVSQGVMILTEAELLQQKRDDRRGPVGLRKGGGIHGLRFPKLVGLARVVTPGGEQVEARRGES